MTTGPRRDTSRARVRAARGIRDHVAVVRHHWISASIAFVLTCGAVLVYFAFEEPVYYAGAYIQLQRERAGGGVLSELIGEESRRQVDTEVVVMESQPVANFASLDQARFPYVIATEKNAYRPWESALRQVRGGRQPCPIRVHTSPAPSGSGIRRLTLSFSADGTSVTIGHTGAGTAPETVDDFVWGRPFQALGLPFTLERLGSDARGHRYDVVVRSISAAIDWLRKGVEVKPVGVRTDIVEVGFNASTPEVAERCANALADAYVRLRRDWRKTELGEGRNWLKKEIGTLETRMKALLHKRDEFASKHNAIFLNERISWVLRHQSDLRVRAMTLAREAEMTDADVEVWKREESVEAKIALIGANGDPITAQLSRELAMSKRNRQALLNGGEKPGTTRVDAVDADIAATRQELELSVGSAVAKRIESLVRSRNAKRASRASMRVEIEKLDAEIESLPEKQRELAVIDRDLRLVREQLLPLRDRVWSLELASRSGNFSAMVLNWAELPSVRKSPKLGRAILIGAVFALGLAIGLAFLLETLSRGIKDSRDIEQAIDIDVLATVPAYRTAPRNERPMKGGGVVTIDRPRSRISEAIRTLRGQILHPVDRNPPKVIAVTSAVAYEGKTTIALNLAATIAQGGQTVVVVDGDMRRPSVVRMSEGYLVDDVCEQDEKYGLSYVLENGLFWRGAVKRTELDGLSVMSAGANADDPGALLGSAAFDQLLADLRANFEFIIIDSPPILSVADAASLFGRVDGVLLVCRQRACTLEQVDGARVRVDRAGGALLGLVFNADDRRGSSYVKSGAYTSAPEGSPRGFRRRIGRT